MKMHKAYPIPEITRKILEAQGRTHAIEYIEVYGFQALMSEKYPPDLKGYKNTEAVYDECLERGCTWEELLDFKGYDPDVML